jgi:flavin-dependent dehydrogenase
VCIGDAAAVLNPASSHGVLKGLMSGMMVGHVIAQAVTGHVAERDAIVAYTAWISEMFHADVKALTQLYHELPRPPARVLERPASFRANPAR